MIQKGCETMNPSKEMAEHLLECIKKERIRVFPKHCSLDLICIDFYGCIWDKLSENERENCIIRFQSILENKTRVISPQKEEERVIKNKRR